MSAMEAFADLYGAIDAEEGDAWNRDCGGLDRPFGEEVKDRWG
jgi:hypothetical protein